MRIIFILLLSTAAHLQSISQYIKLNDGFSLALSGATDATGESLTGASNPAGLSMNENSIIAAHYHNYFMLPELGVQSADIILPVKSGSFAGRINYFGTKALNESRFAISYGHRINSWLAAGIDLNYYHLSVQAFTKRHSAITGNIGIIMQPNKRLKVGILYRNPTTLNISSDFGIKTLTCLQAGITYNQINNFLVSGLLSWTDYRWIDIALGTVVNLTRGLIVRGGIKIPSSMSYSFGMGFKLSRLHFDLGFEQHPVLGLSTAASIIYHVSRHAKK